MRALDRTFVALDGMNLDEARDFLAPRPELTCIKIGLELFTRYGPSVVRAITDMDGRPWQVFLDLKLHDIPTTVQKSVLALQGLPIHFLTLHLSGGREMLKAALEAQKMALPGAKLLGVSYLTSLAEGDFSEIWGFAPGTVDRAFQRLFRLALDTGVQGLVLSPLELDLAKEAEKAAGRKILKVTPGIRFAEGERHDQNRSATFEQAFRSGADYVVMGRALTQCESEDSLGNRIDRLKAFSV